MEASADSGNFIEGLVGFVVEESRGACEGNGLLDLLVVDQLYSSALSILNMQCHHG